ncbi:alpha-1,6-mannosyltransferase [Vermiconidia calcicola]|uniref:Alpha-1,6-mannosyltransferase n=1 Tax=Vermiconidia calcicola TaxID=1690605 RepID=A0ACC3NAS6_9PEZI|nr:alpha-1,6-mannosyltransferase [Vermiconidia calcicola]
MSLDRSPSPHEGGGWSSPGLTAPLNEGNGRLRGGSPSKKYGDLNGAPGHVTWASAKANSARVTGHPSYQSQNEGFFMRHMRRVSSGLPYLSDRARYAEKEKLGRGRPAGRIDWKELPRRTGLLVSRRRKHVALLLLLVLMITLFFNPSVNHVYRRTSWLGGGSKFVIILGANIGGGVMEWKGPREWAIERDSVRNKKRYAAEWGYEMEIVDMSTKKRYAHEWRESWEKVDTIRNAMKKYPDAEWFWWLDLNTFIMEPTYSLQSHIFNDLSKTTYRDINAYNPLDIKHPPNGTSADVNAPKYVNYLDPESLSPVGDGDPNSINVVVPQDCGGFNLGSFFVRRSQWTDRLLDIWWDPVFYEQRHMQWEHKEQDALEYLYTNQPWVRPHVAFISQRKLNAFPSGACGDDRGVPAGGCKRFQPSDSEEVAKYECGLQGIHYQEKERDFLVNMAGCEWGRDCWGEMYNFRQLSNRLNRSPWEKFKDWLHDAVKGPKPQQGPYLQPGQRQ